MIQRIQTVYLLIVAALNLLVVFMPLATVQFDGIFYSFDASGMSTMTSPEALVYPTWALMALSALISLLALVTIFLFRRRMLQIRLCTFPLISLILNWLAIRAIGADEMLVRSLDRLRK